MVNKEKKIKKKKSHVEDYATNKKDVDILWIALVVCILGFGFFKFSIWLRTPDEKTVHIVNHMTKKVRRQKITDRKPRGYSVNFENR